jgi:2-iminobutanoate/2-iminopropanoate deaminase
MNKKVKRDFLIFGLGVLCALTIPLACTRVVEEDPPPQAEPAGGVKVGVHDDNKVKVDSINWGLKVRNFSELFLLSGYGATDAEGTVQFPGDAAAQAEFIVGRIESFIEKNGYTNNDIIRYVTTVTKDVPRSQFSGIRAATSAFLSDVEVKPTAGTFRIVQGLGNPEMLVELDFWFAQ